MELFFESRTNLTGASGFHGTFGKLNFFQRPPTLHPEPVLSPDSFVDGAGTSIYGTVLRDGGIYRMWYQAWPRDWNGQNCDLIGYAESNDGISWRKPRLGLVDYQGRDNNLVDLSGHPPSVFIDPEAPATHRYRATMCTGGGHQGARAHLKGYGYYTAHSADGLSWEYDQHEPQWRSADVITSLYHPGQRRAIVALRYMPRCNGFPRRAIWNAELRNGQWSPAQAALIPDEFDDVAAVARGFGSGDYYGMGMMPAGSGTVGFLWQFRHALPRCTPWGYGVFGVVDVSLAYQSGRGDRWLHVPGRPEFLHHCQPAWGQGGIYTASCPVEVGDEQWLYFAAAARTHGWYMDEKFKINEPLKQELIDGGMCRIGFARWPKWRLFGFRSDPQGGLDLNVGRLPDDIELRLNYCCQKGGSVRAEILKHEGYALSDAVALTGDELAGTIAWRGGSRIPASPEADRLVRLHLDRAEIYAYEVRPCG
jgi:hypothetical protein